MSSETLPAESLPAETLLAESLPATSPALDSETISRLHDLQRRVGPTQDVLGDLSRIYSEDSRRYLEELRVAIVGADDEGIGRLVHTLKGASLGVGAASVSHMCAAWEEEPPPEPLAALERLSALVVVALEELHKQASEPAGTIPNDG